jgi:hypothetical protein
VVSSLLARYHPSGWYFSKNTVLRKPLLKITQVCGGPKLPDPDGCILDLYSELHGGKRGTGTQQSCGFTGESRFRMSGRGLGYKTAAWPPAPPCPVARLYLGKLNPQLLHKRS